MERIADTIRGIIERDIYFDRLDERDDADLIARGILDSTGTMILTEAIAKEFAIDIPGEDVIPRNFGTIAGMAQYVASRI